MGSQEQAAEFVRKWQGVSASELSTAQSFVIDLCDLLGVDRPHPRDGEESYMFERPVTFTHGDGSASAGRIDCYRRGVFVLEAKKIKAGAQTKGFDDALMRARAQAESYARALPATEGRPPFLVVVDVGNVIELYAEFTRSGATYTPFPDARSHRIALADLEREVTRARLRTLWLDPMALDPSRASAKVTREVAVQLAEVARSLEASGHDAQHAAAFLTRCLFSMFAEDVGLLPKLDGGRGAFVDLLTRYRDDPVTLQKMLRAMWADMDKGGFCAVLAKDLLRFNGKLFKGSDASDYVLSLNQDQIDGLLSAAKANWREVEPSIFGTLLERALDPSDRHALGAHYTPRAYVERLVLPTVVEPLRADWANAQAAAHLLASEAEALEGKKREAKLEEARAEIRRFHHQLCTVRVLDPACGSGNFLYVTLEHLKRLEGEVHAQLDALGESQGKLGFFGETVTLQQLRGIEINERAAALAELVLWIGYLQWHIRTFGSASVAEPVIHDYQNIEHRDAVLAYDAREPMRDAAGNIVTRWDGATTKAHHVTGEQVPDESAQLPQWRYVNPRPAAWPEAEFIVGNPPFIGNKRMRDSLGDGYVEALQRIGLPELNSADYVMRWWSHAASLLHGGCLRRFGFITTNSIRQASNRQVTEHLLRGGRVRIEFAIPDHPWVDSTNGAAVRIAMTVAELGEGPGTLLSVSSETEGDAGEVGVSFSTKVGVITSGLNVGFDLARSAPLRANSSMSFMGVILCGDGFFIDSEEASAVRIEAIGAGVVAKYVSGTDLAKSSRGRLAVDFTGHDEGAARDRCPSAYQWILNRVRPERQQNRMERRRREWWLYGSNAPRMRAAIKGLDRYIATARTSKHRVFQFVDGDCLTESNVVAVASNSSLHLGVLSSCVHVIWARHAGATLEDRPHYTNSTTFEPFPFPSDDTGLTLELTARIRNIAERIDAHRKERIAAAGSLTITALYNVLEKLRAGETLTPKERDIHEKGLVSVLRTLHDDLDAAVLEAYGWSDLASALGSHTPASAEARATAVETLLERLVELNAKRAAEEAAGKVRWLRPEFQAAGAATQVAIDTSADEGEEAAAVPASPIVKRPWPTGLPEQIKTIAEVLGASPGPLALVDIEVRFTSRGRWRERLPTILETLEALGRARRVDSGLRWVAA